MRNETCNKTSFFGLSKWIDHNWLIVSPKKTLLDEYIECEKLGNDYFISNKSIFYISLEEKPAHLIGYGAKKDAIYVRCSSRLPKELYDYFKENEPNYHLDPRCEGRSSFYDCICLSCGETFLQATKVIKYSIKSFKKYYNENKEKINKIKNKVDNIMEKQK